AFITPTNDAFPFTAEPATGPGAFYRMDETLADGTQVEGGWVVLNNGEIRGQFHPAPNVTVTQEGTSWWAKLQRGDNALLAWCQYDTTGPLANSWTRVDLFGGLRGDSCPPELLSVMPSDPRTLANQMQQTRSPSLNVPVQGQSGEQMTAQANHANLCLHAPPTSMRPGIDPTTPSS